MVKIASEIKIYKNDEGPGYIGVLRIDNKVFYVVVRGTRKLARADCVIALLEESRRLRLSGDKQS